ncbi:hypothetical protein BO94DRAFT_464511 [Aspergillus sclerotioniger CBS 115572]|uniref:Cyclase n=1 Tax=Aspergillus sclerotioniger CBS 115572 TaxID=1450535 RepID=A0A317WUB0_9EURO|nr:hypothetical protein BO94DRAFT_464511 [Aspergillus sclerotioniger CBS 115572]PWY88882.1 hypothetical protein BO94DRAFT_464511 [Aspergillus sclerotioniger CBS 115572]
MPFEKPAFDDLPLDKTGPPGNAWGLFGPNDQCGMLNLLTSERTSAAAREIIDGVRISTDWALDRITTPAFDRAPFAQTISNKAPASVNDDILQFNTQTSSQWDGLRHYGYQKEQLYFNGRTLDDLLTSKVNGIHAWVENGGIVGRGVLLDYAAWAEANNVPLQAFTPQSITVAVLDEIAKAQGTELKPGDILLIRSGWGRGYAQLSQEEITALANAPLPPAIGLESSEATLRWLWHKEFAAAAGDMPSLEAWPCQDTKYWLHEWLLAGWGLPIGEMFDLEQLSEECRKRQRWSFFFSSVPLKVPGGVASPPNGVAIL